MDKYRFYFEDDLDAVFLEARDIAERVSQQVTSVHLLLALYTVANDAETLLLERGFNEDDLLNALVAVENEPAGVLDMLARRSWEIAKGFGRGKANCIHFLLAICKERECLAYGLLKAAEVPIHELRKTAISRASHELHRRPSSPAWAQTHARSAASLESVAPGPQRKSSSGVSVVDEPPPVFDDAPGAPAGFVDGLSTPDAALTSREEETALAAAETDLSLWELNPKQFPWLTRLGRNLTLLAAQNEIDPLVDRDNELEEVADILGKRRANNPLLIGEPGVGKTAIVEGLARAIVHAPESVPSLARRKLIEIDMNTISAGTQLRGAFAERLNGIRDEVARAAGDIVIFIDEIHTILNSGATPDSNEDAANGLKSALARGAFPCIGATTIDEYKKFIESKDPAFERRFVPVLVREPSLDATVRILRGVAPEYARHHQVEFAEDALEAAVTLSARYISERFLPDKALSVLDFAGSRARRLRRPLVDRESIAQVIEKLSGVPVHKIMMSDGERLIRMEEILGERIIGHRYIIRKVSDVIRRNYAGYHGPRPIGSFLFLGPTGVGKTELVKVLAEFLFQRQDALVRVDMSEFSEPHATSRLIGAPPGYVGYEAGGQLTEQVRKQPYRLILLDEIEKAHPDVLQILLQVLDDGRLTDGRGRTVDFCNTVIVMTSNLGSRHFGKNSRKKVGFNTEQTESEAGVEIGPLVLSDAREHFPAELWNRIDERLVFMPLSMEEIRQIARLELDRSGRHIKREQGIEYFIDESVIQHLLDNGGFQPDLGARPLRQAIQRLIEARVADMILRGECQRGSHVHIAGKNGNLVFEVTPSA
ncbi:MAG: hypothetical protein GMKNLPBB_00633 [Myxococcota bacterium]|nr:hypothetical protein [Myxococcota bacterium]